MVPWGCFRCVVGVVSKVFLDGFSGDFVVVSGGSEQWTIALEWRTVGGGFISRGFGYMV